MKYKSSTIKNIFVKQVPQAATKSITMWLNSKFYYILNSVILSISSPTRTIMDNLDLMTYIQEGNQSTIEGISSVLWQKGRHERPQFLFKAI